MAGVRTRDVHKIDARRQLALQVHFFRHHRIDHRDLHGGLDSPDGIVVNERVAHHAEGALVLSKSGDVGRTLALGQTAAYANEHRHIGHADNGLGNACLGLKGIYGDDRIGVDILNDGHVGAEYKRLDTPAEYADAAAFADTVGHGQRVLTQGAFVSGNVLLHIAFLSSGLIFPY